MVERTRSHKFRNAVLVTAMGVGLYGAYQAGLQNQKPNVPIIRINPPITRVERHHYTHRYLRHEAQPTYEQNERAQPSAPVQAVQSPTYQQPAAEQPRTYEKQQPQAAAAVPMPSAQINGNSCAGYSWNSGASSCTSYNTNINGDLAYRLQADAVSNVEANNDLSHQNAAAQIEQQRAWAAQQEAIASQQNAYAIQSYANAAQAWKNVLRRR
jgi:hypothetical protein